MATSTRQIEQLAEKAYKKLGLRPADGDSDYCILGAACYAKTGLIISQWRYIHGGGYLGFCHLFKRSSRFIAGVITGFDGFEKEGKLTKPYIDGWKFGRRMRRKYITNKFHYTKQKV